MAETRQCARNGRPCTTRRWRRSSWRRSAFASQRRTESILHGSPLSLARAVHAPLVDLAGLRLRARRAKPQNGRATQNRQRRIESGGAEPQESQTGCGSGEPGKVAVPGEHEPRHPYADEWRAGHDRHAPGHAADGILRRFAKTVRISGEASWPINNDTSDFSQSKRQRKGNHRLHKVARSRRMCR